MTPTRISIHCSDTADSKKVTVDEITAWHKARGFLQCGYHYVIYPEGVVAIGRPVNVQGAHVAGENEDNIGICLNGRNRYSAEQFDALKLLLERLCTQFNIQTDQIFGHYEFESAKKQGKTCPGIDMVKFRKWFQIEDPTHSILSAYLLPIKSPKKKSISELMSKVETLGGVH